MPFAPPGGAGRTVTVGPTKCECRPVRSRRPCVANYNVAPEGGAVLAAFGRAFKTPDLRKKLLFTLGIIVLYRIGAHVPVPGVNYANVATCMKQAGGNSGLFALVNMFSGGALLQITIFALGI